MSERPFDVAHLDELERLPVDGGGLTWRPVRRRFGIRAFGVNAYTAAEPGGRVVEEHSEAMYGHEELYFVATGRARFTLDGEDVEAPAGTFVFVQPGTRRGAIAAERDTTVVAIGGKRGAAFEPSAWELWFAAFGYLRAGDEDKGRAALREAAKLQPESWESHYDLACFESLAGRPREALNHLRRAAELDADETRKAAAGDTDLDPIRQLPEFSAIAGQANAGGPGA